MLVNVDQSVSAAGGYLIQLLPGADDAVIDKVEQGIRETGYVTRAFQEGGDAPGTGAEGTSAFEVEILETTPVAYRCYCSRDRVCKALISLGAEELEEMVREQDGAELNCQFCGKNVPVCRGRTDGVGGVSEKIVCKKWENG